jgi:hypothetical protein
MRGEGPSQAIVCDVVRDRSRRFQIHNDGILNINQIIQSVAELYSLICFCGPRRVRSLMRSPWRSYHLPKVPLHQVLPGTQPQPESGALALANPAPPRDNGAHPRAAGCLVRG